MEKELKNFQPQNFLQWGNTKRLRCVKVHVKDDPGNNRAEASTISSRLVNRRNSSMITNTTTGTESPLLSSSAGHRQHPFTSHRVLRNTCASPFGLRSVSDRSSSQRSERQNHHPREGSGKASAEAMVMEEKVANQQGKIINDGSSNVRSNHESIYNVQSMVWPRFIISLGIKEKEEDFMAMKGSKLPQRPRKRSKFLQRTLNLVSRGSWLCELTQERYEGREKKTNKKRSRGLKATVRSMDSDSD